MVLQTIALPLGYAAPSDWESTTIVVLLRRSRENGTVAQSRTFLSQYPIFYGKITKIILNKGEKRVTIVGIAAMGLATFCGVCHVA